MLDGVAVFPSEDVTFESVSKVMEVDKHFHAKSWEVLPAFVARIFDYIMVHPLVQLIFKLRFSFLLVSKTLS
jgi:hypothetical protein